MGDNGAGKSTLVKVISGVGPPVGGQVVFEGKPVTISRPQDATHLGIATVYQDLALCDNLDVVDNLFLGEESRGRHPRPFGWLDEIGMEKRALELLRTLSVSIPSVRIPVASLSGGQRQTSPSPARCWATRRSSSSTSRRPRSASPRPPRCSTSSSGSRSAASPSS